MQSLEDLAKKYQNMLREKYPDIVVCLDPDASDDFLGGMFGVFSIPDDKEEEYSQYIYGEFPSILVKQGIEFVSIVIHTDSVTQRYYPAQWGQVSEARRAMEDMCIFEDAFRKSGTDRLLKYKVHGTGAHSDTSWVDLNDTQRSGIDEADDYVAQFEIDGNALPLLQSLEDTDKDLVGIAKAGFGIGTNYTAYTMLSAGTDETNVELTDERLIAA